jgi:hypothetical protein
VNRLKEQLSFVSRVLEHWRFGIGSDYNPSRKTALKELELCETLEDVIKTFPVKPLVVTTSSHKSGIPRTTFKDLRTRIWEGADDRRPVLLVFGTGSGLHEDVFKQADILLEPLKGDSKDDYRYLSVRSAVSIVLDRLLGAW